MRTTLERDDQLVEALMARHPDLSKTEAIQMAIRAYLSSSAQSELRRLAGTLDIQDVSEKWRLVDRRT